MWLFMFQQAASVGICFVCITNDLIFYNLVQLYTLHANVYFTIKFYNQSGADIKLWQPNQWIPGF